MAAIAERGGFAVFAAAKIGSFTGLGGELRGSEIAALVAAVAEGLVFGGPAGAPEIGFSSLQFDRIGGLLGNDRCV